MSRPFRVVFLTNLTTTVNLAVLEALANSASLQLSHVFLYDTVTSSGKSLITTLRQLGIRRVVSKSLGLVSSRIRTFIGKKRGAQHVRIASVWEYCQIASVPYSVIENLNRGPGLDTLKDLAPDILVVCVCKNILNDAVLGIPSLKAVNLHPSLLPRYRGPTPTFWMKYHGEKETGLTFHLITPRIDRGPILRQFIAPLDRNRSDESIERELFTEAASQIEDVLLQMMEGRLEMQQPVGQGSYQSFPTAEDRRELQNRLRQGVK